MLKLIALPIVAAAILAAAPVAYAENADQVDLSSNYWNPQGLSAPKGDSFGAPRVTGAIRSDLPVARPAVGGLDVDIKPGMNPRFSNTGINF